MLLVILQDWSISNFLAVIYGYAKYPCILRIAYLQGSSVLSIGRKTPWCWRAVSRKPLGNPRFLLPDNETSVNYLLL